MRGTLNGWQLVHVRTLQDDHHICFESQDARIYGKWFEITAPVQAVLAEAGANDIYCVRFKESVLAAAVLLQKG